MAFNDVMAQVRQKLSRGFGRGGDRDIQVASRDPRVERLEGEIVATPRADVYEGEHEVVIQLDVPGADRNETVVSWDASRGISILARRSDAVSGTPWRSEYEPRAWYRAFHLPEHLDGSRASSTLRDGVLRIHIPKRAAESRRISVKAG